jgi:hypothetical protein
MRAFSFSAQEVAMKGNKQKQRVQRYPFAGIVRILEELKAINGLTLGLEIIVARFWVTLFSNPYKSHRNVPEIKRRGLEGSKAHPVHRSYEPERYYLTPKERELIWNKVHHLPDGGMEWAVFSFALGFRALEGDEWFYSIDDVVTYSVESGFRGFADLSLPFKSHVAIHKALTKDSKDSKEFNTEILKRLAEIALMDQTAKSSLIEGWGDTIAEEHRLCAGQREPGDPTIIDVVMEAEGLLSEDEIDFPDE